MIKKLLSAAIFFSANCFAQTSQFEGAFIQLSTGYESNKTANTGMYDTSAGNHTV